MGWGWLWSPLRTCCAWWTTLRSVPPTSHRRSGSIIEDSPGPWSVILFVSQGGCIWQREVFCFSWQSVPSKPRVSGAVVKNTCWGSCFCQIWSKALRAGTVKPVSHPLTPERWAGEFLVLWAPQPPDPVKLLNSYSHLVDSVLCPWNHDFFFPERNLQILLVSGKRG